MKKTPRSSSRQKHYYHPKSQSRLRIKCEGLENLREIQQQINIAELAETNMSMLEAIQQKAVALDVQELIFGPDNRVELYNAPASMQKNAIKAAALMRIERIKRKGSRADFEISPSGKYVEHQGTPLCDEEPFKGQDQAAFATAVAIEDHLLITPEHVLDGDSVKEDYRIVYGFWYESPQANHLEVLDMYTIKEIRPAANSKLDLSFLITHEPIRSEYISTKFRNQMPKIGERLYCAGYPGTKVDDDRLEDRIPLKVVTDGSVKNHLSNGKFEADLDIFRGNSGSPVYSKSKHELAGMVLSAFPKHFQMTAGGCFISCTCESDRCKWPKILSIQAILEAKQFLKL